MGGGGGGGGGGGVCRWKGVWNTAIDSVVLALPGSWWSKALAL